MDLVPEDLPEGPEIGEMAKVEPEEPRGRLFGARKAQKDKFDEFGIRKPSGGPKWKQVVGTLLPTALGVLGGGGIVPSLGVSMQAQAGAKMRDRERYEKERMQRLKAMEPPKFAKEFEYYRGLSPEDRESAKEFRQLGRGDDFMKMMALQKFDFAKSQADWQKGWKKQREEDRIDKEVQREVRDLSRQLSKDIIPVETSLSQITDLLGFDIMDVDPVTGKVNGASPDLPGANIPLFGRQAWPGSVGAAFKNKVKTWALQTKKAISGTASSDKETEDILETIGSGKFGTDKELLAAMRAAVERLNVAKQNIMSGYSPKAVTRFEQQRERHRQKRPQAKTPKVSKSQKDQDLEWARANPSDPIAKEMLQLYGVN
jgi:hypothetical protein